METFTDFCKWAGTQRKAAELLGVSEASVSRMARGDMAVSKRIAERVEEVTHGIFKKERVMWPSQSAVPQRKAA